MSGSKLNQTFIKTYPETAAYKTYPTSLRPGAAGHKYELNPVFHPAKIKVKNQAPFSVILKYQINYSYTQTEKRAENYRILKTQNRRFV